MSDTKHFNVTLHAATTGWTTTYMVLATPLVSTERRIGGTGLSMEEAIAEFSVAFDKYAQELRELDRT